MKGIATGSGTGFAARTWNGNGAGAGIESRTGAETRARTGRGVDTVIGAELGPGTS